MEYKFLKFTKPRHQLIFGPGCDSNYLTSYPLQQKSCHVKMNPIRNSLEPKKTLRCLRDIYVSPKYKGGNKNVNQVEGKELSPGFILRIQKASWVNKNEELVRGEARVRGSSIPENVWTRLKFFRQIAVPVPVHFRASFEAGPEGRKFPFR